MKTCPQCGTIAASELPGGLCATCLMAVARRSLSERDLARTQSANQLESPELAEMTRLFPDFEILELIGRGGMGAVYKAREKSLDRIIALKVFLYRPDDPEFAARFQREARALARLKHPNIVTVYSTGQRERLHYLTMDFIDGVNLRQLTAEERLPPQLALQMVPQLCDALQYAHDAGVVHRDIKPENLMLDTNGQIHIADFGLAKVNNALDGTLTRSQQIMGTLNYMAPEQRESPMVVDHRADIYSLGVVIYEMLTGELPIGRFQPPSDKSDIDQRLDEVVMRALEKEPGRRYQQASEFKTGLESVGSALPGREPVAPLKQPKTAFDHGTDEGSGARYSLSLMSGTEKRGAWRPGSPQVGFTMMGASVFDLTEVDEDYVDILLFTLMGGAEVVVPFGAQVDLDGLMIMGATVDTIDRTHSPNSTMRVRVRSWGAMGSCDVRTPNRKEERIKRRQQKALERKQRTEEMRKYAREVGVAGTEATMLGAFLVLLYRCFALLITIGIPVAFVAGSMGILPRQDGNALGCTLAILCFFAWSGLKHFRVIVRGGPEDQDAETVNDYLSQTMLGGSLRLLATYVLAACPILFVLSRYRVPLLEWSSDTSKFAAIVCAILAIVLFNVATWTEEMVVSQQPTNRDR